MKNTSKLIGIICLAAVILFGMAACDNPAQSVEVDISPALSRIVVISQPVKTLYDLNEEFDPAGMVVAAIYADGTYDEITDYTVSSPLPVTENFPGVKSVIVSYKGKTASFVVNVINLAKEKCPPVIATVNGVPITDGEYPFSSGIVLKLELPPDAPADAQIWYNPTGLNPGIGTDRSIRVSDGGTINIAANTLYKIAVCHPDYYNSDILIVRWSN